MRTAVDHDQVRIMWHWICENLKDPNFRAIAPKHYLDEPRRVEWAFDKLVEFERNFDAPYCVILGDCHQGNTYILPNGERLWLDWQLSRRGDRKEHTSELQSLMRISYAVFCLKKKRKKDD